MYMYIIYIHIRILFLHIHIRIYIHIHRLVIDTHASCVFAPVAPTMSRSHGAFQNVEW